MFINSSDLLTYLALVLAYSAYVWSVERDFQSWKSLFISIKKEMETHKSWLSGEYFLKTYKDKNSYLPSKIIYPLSFTSIPEIIRRGASENPKISNDFIGLLSIFNERVNAFNSVLEQIRICSSSNPLLSEELIDKLKLIGLEDKNVSYEDFKKKIFSLKKKDKTYFLAENLHRLNKVIHLDLIGNKKNGMLNFLYQKIDNDLNHILNSFEDQKPFFIKYKNLIILLSVVMFIFIEILLKNSQITSLYLINF